MRTGGTVRRQETAVGRDYLWMVLYRRAERAGQE